MDYKRVLRLHFVNHLSGREIAESCGDCSKTTVNEFLKRFRENPELSYPLPVGVTNEYIESILYKKPGVSANQLLYRDFNKEAVQCVTSDRYLQTSEQLKDAPPGKLRLSSSNKCV